VDQPTSQLCSRHLNHLKSRHFNRRRGLQVNPALGHHCNLLVFQAINRQMYQQLSRPGVPLANLREVQLHIQVIDRRFNRQVVQALDQLANQLCSRQLLHLKSLPQTLQLSHLLNPASDRLRSLPALQAINLRTTQLFSRLLNLLISLRFNPALDRLCNLRVVQAIYQQIAQPRCLLLNHHECRQFILV